MPRLDSAPSIADRIQQRARELGRPLKGDSGVLTAAGLSSSFVTDLRRNPDQSPKAASLRRLADAMNTELLWLAEGRGPKEANTATGGPSSELLVIPEFVPSNGRQQKGGADVRERQLELPAKFMLPLASASVRDLAFSENLGEAMAPILQDGDIVIVDRAAKNPVYGGIFGVLLFERDELIFRRVQRLPAAGQATLRITAENPAYETFDVGADEVEIVGRVTWFGRRL